eukprot:CAMPEP_0205923080 /NCGR_PEP_ID=MMETSP1325-20131115/15583_1 /ASSEMBLY_ACC=CAM_ASM_000708 /TAXON_ID=236786 /ORGANISM="Florenciella sp., Strain RCC1007" /LENGTH=142 /DNA_ID=CAMNT_0053291227 /DNA_START=41 /DNA_END=469 /DNA_ORIENTATION=+
MAEPVKAQPGVPVVVAGSVNSVEPGKWSSGLYDCCEDPVLCIYALCCPHCALGHAIEAGSRGQESCCTVCCLAVLIDAVVGGLGPAVCICMKRPEFRKNNGNLPEGECSDCCGACCCQSCTIAQMMRHMKATNPGATGKCGM